MARAKKVVEVEEASIQTKTKEPKYIKTIDNSFFIENVCFDDPIEVSEKMLDSKKFKRAIDLKLIKKI